MVMCGESRHQKQLARAVVLYFLLLGHRGFSGYFSFLLYPFYFRFWTYSNFTGVPSVSLVSGYALFAGPQDDSECTFGNQRRTADLFFIYHIYVTDFVKCHVLFRTYHPTRTIQEHSGDPLVGSDYNDHYGLR